MYNHAPENYKCPLCLAGQGVENEYTMVKQADIFYKDELVFAMINSKFIRTNPGHVIVVPTEHYENIYDISNEVGHRIFDVSKVVALALKEIRGCDGIMIKQNNEPASGQHAFHYHMHVIPRFNNDNLGKKVLIADPKERLPYADELRKYFSTI